MASRPWLNTNSQRLALQTRERFLADARKMLDKVGEGVQQHLQWLLDQPSTARDMQDRFDAFTLYRQKRQAWLDATARAWESALRTPEATQTRPAELGLELMGMDVMENRIIASRMAMAIMEKVLPQFEDLRVRIEHLEHNELSSRDVLRAEVLALVLIEQWVTAGLPRGAIPAVVDLIQKIFAEHLLASYRACNEALIAEDVLPTIELQKRVRRTPSAAPQGARGQPPGPAAPTTLDSLRGGGDSDDYGNQGGYDGTGAQGYGGQQGRADYGGGQAAPAGQARPRGSQGGGSAGGSQQFASPGGGSGGWGGPGPANAGGGQWSDNGDGGRFAAGSPAGAAAVADPGSGGARGGQGGPAGGAGVGGRAGAEAPPMRPGSESGAQGARRAGVNVGADSDWSGRTRVGGRPTAPMEETRMMTNTTPLARARMRAQGVLGQLKRLLVNQVGDFEKTQLHGPSPALAEALSPAYQARQQAAAPDGGAGSTLVMDYSPAGVAHAAGVLREQTTELKKKASTDSEKATIEVVALMFQSILAEERIPPAIRVWFARLQLPVLRVALAEPEFFSSMNHPARQLIDRMGACVMGFDAQAINGSAMEIEIKRVVQVIEQYPETGGRVFQLVFDEFQKFLLKYLTEKEVTQRVVSVAQQVEQKETLAIQYTIEMRNLLKDMPVADEIREFLFKVWAEVLALAAIRKGAQHQETLELKQIAPELVWSASAKPNRKDRARVIQELPQLLQRLRQGMSLLGLEESVQEGHLKLVSDTLAAAFLSKAEPIAPARIEAMAKRLANIEEFVTDEGLGDLPLDAENLELMLGIDSSMLQVISSGGSRPNEAMIAWAMELQPGNWFTLEHNGAVQNVQFSWRSQRKQLFLFAASGGSNYLMQRRRLASYLQAGLLLPQDEEALTLRATRTALAKLDANPERLLH